MTVSTAAGSRRACRGRRGGLKSARVRSGQLLRRRARRKEETPEGVARGKGRETLTEDLLLRMPFESDCPDDEFGRGSPIADLDGVDGRSSPPLNGERRLRLASRLAAPPGAGVGESYPAYGDLGLLNENDCVVRLVGMSGSSIIGSRNFVDEVDVLAADMETVAPSNGLDVAGRLGGEAWMEPPRKEAARLAGRLELTSTPSRRSFSRSRSTRVKAIKLSVRPRTWSLLDRRSEATFFSNWTNPAEVDDERLDSSSSASICASVVAVARARRPVLSFVVAATMDVMRLTSSTDSGARSSRPSVGIK